MTILVNVVEAKAKLSALLDAAERGEEVVIARAGVPAVRLTPVPKKASRQLGLLKQLGYEADPDLEFFAPDPADAEDSELVNEP